MDQNSSNARAAVTNAGLSPRKVPLCSPGFHVSYSGRIGVTAIGIPCPLMGLGRQTMSRPQPI
jgi:hypothetical protein